MDNSLKISVVIPTRNRPEDLADLLSTLLNQDHLPLEVLIIDDSEEDSTKRVTDLFKPDFEAVGCKLKYVKGNCDGLPAARNLGVKISRGDLILFLDDDILLLDKNTIKSIVTFFEKNPKALGVQPKVLSPTIHRKQNGMQIRFKNYASKLLMLTYRAKNKQKVRKSGTDIFPNGLTKAINVQRLSGCCFCFKREVFKSLKFDENLKRWGFMEDLDFSYRVYKKYPQSLYLIPNAKVIHKASKKGRLPPKLRTHMIIIYWFYVFFKEIFEDSVLNLLAFLWALTGNLIATIGSLIIKRKQKREWWKLIYMLEAYTLAFKNLKKILSLDLYFFNKQLCMNKEINSKATKPSTNTNPRKGNRDSKITTAERFFCRL